MPRYQTVASEVKFQFHNGSIKSESAEVVKAAQEGFNSTMVRLKEYDEHHRLLQETGFNSTMVRLKVIIAGICLLGYGMFQFHNGSIKRVKRQVSEIIRLARFNSTMVRLKVGVDRMPVMVM